VSSRIERELGPVSALVNCAAIIGYVDGRRPALQETTVETWNRVFAVNALGAFLSVREMFRRRRDRPVENGRIVLTGSMAAQDGGKNSPCAYVASKGAVHALVRSAAHEAIALDMTVNCVAPGVIDTPLLRSALSEERRAPAFAGMPMGRPGSSSEVAAAIDFLMSPQAAFICGACLDVNGGMRFS
jgi:3-oxoacyl-[acyl-carrier protein] reductase